MRRAMAWVVVVGVAGCASEVGGTGAVVADAVEVSAPEEDTGAGDAGDDLGSEEDAGPTGACAGKADGTPCEDGNICTVDDVCAGGVCSGGASRACDDVTACRTGECVPDEGCVYEDRPDGTPCATACFETATCQAGACQVDPGSATPCPAPESPCVEKLVCDPASGACTKPVYRAAGATCDADDDACTLDECDGAGVCQAGAVETCATQQQNNPCWTWTCNKSKGCTQTAFVSGVSCSDNNPCTVNDTCSENEVGQKLCVGAPIPVDDGNPCTDDACAGGTVSHTPVDGATCDPEGECSSGTCAAGVCEPAASCGPCTQDSDCPAPALQCLEAVCDTGTGQCGTFPKGAVECDDGDACTTGDVCDGAVCSGSPADCDDGDDCTTDSCEGGGCTHTALDTPECGGGTVTPLGSGTQGFDVDDAGNLTAARISGDQVEVSCISASGTPIEDWYVLEKVPGAEAAQNEVYVTRADVAGVSVVAAHLEFPDGDDDTAPTTWRLYFLDSSCQEVTSVDLQSPSADVSYGTTEYFDIDQADAGQVAVVYWTRSEPSGSSWREFRQFTATGGAIGSPLKFGDGLCTSSNGIRVAMQASADTVIITCQNHAFGPVYYQRFSGSGSALDGAMVPVPGSEEGSSWYDSHAVGMNDSGAFVVVYAQSNSDALRASFFDSGANVETDVEIGPLDRVWDGYRNRHPQIQITSTGDFVIPRPEGGPDIPCASVYSPAGVAGPTVGAGGECFLVRADGGDMLYVLPTQGASSLTTTPIP